MTEFYNIDSFQNYLSDRQANISIVDDVLWVNTIPLPTTIVDDIFSLGDELFTAYAESLLSAFILAHHDLSNGNAGNPIFPKMPDPAALENSKERILNIFAEAQITAEFKSFESALFKALGTKTKSLSNRHLRI